MGLFSKKKKLRRLQIEAENRRLKAENDNLRLQLKQYWEIIYKLETKKAQDNKRNHHHHHRQRRNSFDLTERHKYNHRRRSHRSVSCSLEDSQDCNSDYRKDIKIIELEEHIKSLTKYVLKKEEEKKKEENRRIFIEPLSTDSN
tara:strand:+ start:685 stop:1116 length:432 start_codon:yes stop_codon:yes gene_type:complete